MYRLLGLPRLNRERAGEVMARLERVTDESKPLWGSFAPGAMINHLRRALAASGGVTQFEDMSTWYLRNVMRHRVLMGLKRIPRNKIKLPAHFLDLRARPVAKERGRFEIQLNDFLDSLDVAPQRKAMHPYFGELTMLEWARWHWLHFDHHLRQFGV